MDGRSEESFNAKFVSDNQKFVSYCEFYDISTLAVDSQALDYIEKSSDKLDALIAGYSEMATLNREICSEFSNCECEAMGLGLVEK